MVCCTSCALAKPSWVAWLELRDSASAWRVESEHCCAELLNCSMAAALSSKLAAVASVRALRSLLPLATCALAVEMLSEACSTWRKVSFKVSRIWSMDCSNWPLSSRL